MNTRFKEDHTRLTKGLNAAQSDVDEVMSLIVANNIKAASNKIKTLETNVEKIGKNIKQTQSAFKKNVTAEFNSIKKVSPNANVNTIARNANLPGFKKGSGGIFGGGNNFNMVPVVNMNGILKKLKTRTARGQENKNRKDISNKLSGIKSQLNGMRKNVNGEKKRTEATVQNPLFKMDSVVKMQNEAQKQINRANTIQKQINNSSPKQAAAKQKEATALLNNANKNNNKAINLLKQFGTTPNNNVNKLKNNSKKLVNQIKNAKAKLKPVSTNNRPSNLPGKKNNKINPELAPFLRNINSQK